MPKQLIAFALTLALFACNADPASSPSPLTSNDGVSSTVSIVSSSVSKPTLIAGEVQSAAVTLTSTATLNGLYVDIRIYKSLVFDSMYANKPFYPVTLTAGSQQLLTFDFQSPADMPPGQYDVRVGVWDAAWNTLLYETTVQFTVNAPAATPRVSIVSSSVSKNPLTPGQVQSAAVKLTSTTTLNDLYVDIRIYKSLVFGPIYANKAFYPVTLTAGAQQLLTFDFQSPADMPPGQYDVRVGVWDAAWNTLLYETTAQFTVGGTSFVMNCQEGALLAAGSYVVENNQWGRGGVTGNFSQCVANGGVAGDGSVSARWTWTWPSGPNEIKGYPAIVFGQKPGYGPTPNSNLPMRVNALSQVTSSWSTRSSYTGQGQLTFDLWLTRDGLRRDRFIDTPITHEIMVAVEPYGGYGLVNRNPAWQVDDTTIGGVRYKVYKAEGFGAPAQSWRFLVFQRQTPLVSGSLDFKPLFDYLKSRGFIQGDEYLASIEFGSELVEGSGEVTVDSFKATVR